MPNDAGTERSELAISARARAAPLKRSSVSPPMAFDLAAISARARAAPLKRRGEGERPRAVGRHLRARARGPVEAVRRTGSFSSSTHHLRARARGPVEAECLGAPSPLPGSHLRAR